jgi:hypothetical protein
MSPTRKPSSVAALRRGVGTSTSVVPTSGVDVSSPAPKPPRPEKPVRFTLDLDRETHTFLKTFALGAEVSASVVLRELLGELDEDAELANRVRFRIWSARK